MPDSMIYKYREGAHGEHCIDVGRISFERLSTLGRAATKADAEAIIEKLNENSKGAACRTTC